MLVKLQTEFVSIRVVDFNINSIFKELSFCFGTVFSNGVELMCRIRWGHLSPKILEQLFQNCADLLHRTHPYIRVHQLVKWCGRDFSPGSKSLIGHLPFFLTSHIINNIGTKMKMKNMNEFVRSTAVRSRGPRQTYNLGFDDETRGFAVEVSCGRMIEKSSRRKIFYQLYT
jgi:hypothetical protein